MKILDKLWFSRHPKDALFLELIEGYEIKELNGYPNILFYVKNDIILFKYDILKKHIFINYQTIGSIFKDKFSLNIKEFKQIINVLLETYLNLTGIEPKIQITSESKLLIKKLRNINNENN